MVFVFFEQIFRSMILRIEDFRQFTEYYVLITPTQSIIDQIAGPHLSQEESKSSIIFSIHRQNTKYSTLNFNKLYKTLLRFMPLFSTGS